MGTIHLSQIKGGSFKSFFIMGSHLLNSNKNTKNSEKSKMESKRIKNLRGFRFLSLSRKGGG
jgi:hypothetical protein